MSWPTFPPLPADAAHAAGFKAGPEETVLQSKVFSVTKAEFTDPGGQPFSREILRHPGAVAVVPLCPGERSVLLVNQYRPALNQFLLEVPAGCRDVEDEPLELCAARELAEEAGMAAGRLDFLCRFHNAPGYADEEIHLFLGRDLTPVATNPQGPEEQHLQIYEVALADIDQLMADGRLTDAKTIIGLQQTRLLLAAGN